MLIKEEMKKVPSSDSILIGGFGKGGALALFVGYPIHFFSVVSLQYGNQLGGIVSVNGYVPNSFAKVNTRSFKTETPILALHGKKNPVVSIERVQVIRNRYQRALHQKDMQE